MHRKKRKQFLKNRKLLKHIQDELINLNTPVMTK